MEFDDYVKICKNIMLDESVYAKIGTLNMHVLISYSITKLKCFKPHPVVL